MSFTIAPPASLTTQRLNAALRGDDPLLSRTAAFHLLLTSDVSADVPDKPGLLRSIAENQDEPARSRYLAVTTLYRLNQPGAEEVLIDLARKVADAQVLTAVVQSLGRIGTEKALDAIMQARERIGEEGAVRVAFAAALLAHRRDLPGHELPGPRDSALLALDPKKARPFILEPSGDAEARIALESFAAEPFGIRLSAHALYQVRCERHIWMIMLNEEWIGPVGIAELTQRKALLAIVASKSEVNNSYSAAFLVLTAPTGAPGAFDVKVHLTGGAQAFVGSARVEGDAANFEINSVSRPGIFPLQLVGRLQGDELTAQTALASPFVPLSSPPTCG